MIYICIPCRDEADTIGVLLWKARKVMGDFGRDYHVIVHDDASSDDTAEVLQRYARTLPLTVLRSTERIGYARSVEKLLRHVVAEAPYPKRDCAVVLQGDFTEDPADIVSLVKTLEGGVDIVAGAASSEPGASYPRSMRLVRWLAGTLFRGAVRRAPVTDPLGGLRAYRVIVLKKAFRDLRADEPVLASDGWAANVELLGVLAPHARRIGEAPFTVRYDLQVRESRFNAWRTIASLARLPGSLWSSLDPEAA